MSKTVVPFELRDDFMPSRKTVVGRIAISEHGIEILFDDYGVFGDPGSAPIIVEFWNQHVQLFAWTDINDDGDPVKIDLEGARLDRFVEGTDG